MGGGSGFMLGLLVGIVIIIIRGRRRSPM
jgi:hypothetical protein